MPFVQETHKVWGSRSWLLGGALTGDRLWALLVALHVSAGMLILASAAAMAFAAWVPGWWRPLAIAGGALGLAAFAVFWDGQIQRMVEQGAIGAALSLLLLGGAIAFPKAFG